MMPFFNRTGLERFRVVGPKIGLLLLGWTVGSGCGTACKDKKEEGVGASPVAAPMPKSVPR